MELFGGILTSIIASLTTLGSIWLKNYLEQRAKTKHIVEEVLEQNKIIYELLGQTKQLIEADYIGVFQFHNGSSYYTGEPMQKVSCTHEICSLDTVSLLSKYQNFPISLFRYPLLELIEHPEGIFIIDDIEKHPNISLKAQMFQSGYNAAYGIEIRGVRNKRLYGVIIINYKEATILSDNELSLIKDNAQLIATYLEQRNIKEL